MHGQYLREVNDKDQNSALGLLRKSDLRGYTEALICSPQEQPLHTIYIKFNIDKTSVSPLCRMLKVKQFYT